MKTRWWLEIGPLREGNYTGISQVTAAIAGCMLEDASRDCRFFYGRAVVPRDVVAGAVERRSCELLEWYVARAEPAAAPEGDGAYEIAIFPNRKSCRRGFACETQIVHDLSTLLTPQFHGAETVDYHALSIREDIHSNDLTFCVSEATRDDVLRYLGPLDPARVIVTPLGTTITPAGPEDREVVVEPYVLVLGTIEPRKNIQQVLQFLAEQPQVLRALRFVFLGRFGWGETVEALLARHGLNAAFDAGRIVFPGFVSDAAKRRLLLHARLLIYPSLFEGFGLPVLEALTLGTPCLTTRSSSLPEVGGAVCSYFDPFVAGDFARGFAGALHDTAPQREARMRHAARFSWAACWRSMTEAIEAHVSRDDVYGG
jgi:glycosyltransferase involved in cell wall biosynthesis